MTFSIVALERRSQTLGVATATGAPFVRNRVPHLRVGVGAIATQGFTEISYGVNGLRLLEACYPPTDVLEMLVRSDPGKDRRQVLIIDAHGRKAAFTGGEVPDHKGQILGRDYVIGGNLLATEDVIWEMADAFKRGEIFVEKLLFALEAGKRAGGDVRGERSAALIVASHKTKRYLDLRVDDHRDPLRELRRLLEQDRRFSMKGS